jgi:hypothetical protein
MYRLEWSSSLSLVAVFISDILHIIVSCS